MKNVVPEGWMNGVL